MTAREAAAPGAVWSGDGVEFTLPSAVAEAVEVCLLDAEGDERARHAMTRRGDSWWARVGEVGPGQRYGYRVAGPYAPDRGHRCNPAKLLLDPWARAVCGDLQWHPAVHGYGSGGPNGEPSLMDSAPFVPHSVVVDTDFDWRDDRSPEVPWADTVIYEAHVRGLTMRHPEVPAELRGTYLGLAHEAMIEHLVRLGVTAVELLPVHHFVSERHLAANGLTNYWGYNPLAWFAPHAGYAAEPGRQVVEFKTMVRSLHRAGIEVLLDVVYNHTAEGGVEGATLSLRGLDNALYYRAPEGDPSRCEDFTGCGNTLDFGRPAVRDLALASLRYWVEEMHVDGFRFDLAPVLGRGPDGFDPRAPMLRRLAEDPALTGVKLIAEPWDLGPGGYCLGRFPADWREWNDRFRDSSRRFWRGDEDGADELPRRLLGSTDLLDRTPPNSSIHYVAAHDGLTLADLVSFSRKHNEANGENNRDGSNHDHSDNLGVEGPTADESLLERRRNRMRALLATVALSHGAPMLGHGDELGRTQRGNNNAYCQDNELSWIDWELETADEALLRFTRRALALRRELRLGADRPEVADLTWLDLRGLPLGDEAGSSGAVGFTLEWESGGERRLLVAYSGDRSFSLSLPAPGAGRRWRLRMDSAAPAAEAADLASTRYSVAAESLVLLTCEEATT